MLVVRCKHHTWIRTPVKFCLLMMQPSALLVKLIQVTKPIPVVILVIATKIPGSDWNNRMGMEVESTKSAKNFTAAR